MWSSITTDGNRKCPRGPLPLCWTLTFPKGWGADQPLTISRLQPWCELPLSDEGKAFSGTVTYETSFQMDRLHRKSQYLIRLGQVEEIAVVKINDAVADTTYHRSGQHLAQPPGIRRFPTREGAQDMGTGRTARTARRKWTEALWYDGTRGDGREKIGRR